MMPTELKRRKQSRNNTTKGTSSRRRFLFIVIVFSFIWFTVQASLWIFLVDGHSSNKRANSNINNTSKKDISSDNIDSGDDDDDDDFHIVFSTDCSGYQHWQGILLYYSAIRVGQRGTVTRIASGCTPKEQNEIQNEWLKIDPTRQKFRVHFAPSTTLNGKSYKYSNKPGGILHWLQSQKSELESKNDTVVCLLDPDMILLKPITSHLIQPNWIRRSYHQNQIEYIDPTLNNNLPQVLRMKDVDNDDKLVHKITTGHPAGQHFGIGGAWVNSGIMAKKPVWANFSKASICGNTGQCTKTTMEEAKTMYAAGPVYLATVQDWIMIAQKWWEFVPTVHQQYPYLLAEMYAFTMAVAHLQVKFHLFSNFMITGAEVSSGTEAWAWIDDYYINNENGGEIDSPDKVLSNTTTIAAESNHKRQRWTRQVCPTIEIDNTGGDQNAFNNNYNLYKFPIPNILHYCQRYKLDLQDQSFLFAKRKIPHDVFSCTNQNEKIPFELNKLIQQLQLTPNLNNCAISALPTIERRTIFAHCQLVSMLDWARKRYHSDVCKR